MLSIGRHSTSPHFGTVYLHLPFMGTFYLTLLGDILLAFIEGHFTCPQVMGAGDILFALVGGHSTLTHSETLYICVLNWGHQSAFPYWGTFYLLLFGLIWGCIEGYLTCPFGTFRICPYWETFYNALIGGHSTCPYWGTLYLPLLGDVLLALIG